MNKLEVLYRIYQVEEQQPDVNIETSRSNSYSKQVNTELTMDCIICDTRNHFKEIIKSMYGDDIKFAFSKKLKAGDLYCVIIGEHCYNSERYFVKKEAYCSHCGIKITSYKDYYFRRINDNDIKWSLYNTLKDYSKIVLCSDSCKHNYIEKEKRELSPNADNEFYIRKDDFTSENVNGYIYKITKKDTNEFYVGKTVYAPIWRWGQHLLTDRFPINEIENYKFEVIEVVNKVKDLSEREKHWINKCYLENPSLCLNIQLPSLVEEEE